VDANILSFLNVSTTVNSLFRFMLWLFYLQVKHAFGVCSTGDWMSLTARLEAVAKRKIAVLDRGRTPAFIFLSQSLLIEISRFLTLNGEYRLYLQ
jgi:hypothetical protein